MSEQWMQRAVQQIHENTKIVNSSGAGITGIAYNTPGLLIQYRADNQSTWTTMTPVAGTLGVYVSGSFIGDQNGRYQIDLPSSVYATTAAKEILVDVSGIPGQMPDVLSFTRQLVGVNPQDSAAGGMSDLAGAQQTGAAVTLPSAVPAGYATSANQTTIISNVAAITTNVARAKMVMPTFMARPTSGSSVYAITVYLYNLEGHLEDADTNTITIGAANAAGTSLNAGLSSTTMTRVSAGLYTVNYTVNSTDATGEAIYTISWAVGGVAMATAMASMIEDAESLATLAAIEAKTNLIATNAGDSPNAVAAQGTISTLSSTTATAAAAAILVTPSNKLTTDVNGNVTFNNAIPVPPTTTQIQAALAAGTPLPAVLSASQDFNNTGQTTPYPTSGGGGGSGSAALSFTVKSTAAGTPVIPNATISVIDASGAAVTSGVTNGSGVASGMACAPGSYTYAVYAGNFAGISGTLTPAPVAGNNPYVFSLTPNTLPIPSNPSECNVGIMIQEGAGQTGNVTITAIMTRVPPGSGNWFVGQTSTVVLVPGTQGYLTLYQNAQYSFSDGNTLIYQTIPPQTTWELPNTFS